ELESHADRLLRFEYIDRWLPAVSTQPLRKLAEQLREGVGPGLGIHVLLWGLLPALVFGVLGIDHITFLLATLGGTGSSAPAARGSCTVAAGLCLVEQFRDFVQALLHPLPRRLKLCGVVAFEVLLGVGEHALELSFLVAPDLLRVVAERLLRLVDQRVEGVFLFDPLPPSVVFARVGFGVLDHALDLILLETTRPLDANRLFLPCGAVFGRYREDPIRVDVEGDFDLREPARGGRDAVEDEAPELAVVARHLALA